MSMHELKNVTLGDIKGLGYAFKRKTAFGQARHGIFYPESEEDVEKIQEVETLTFSGPCYYQTRGPRQREFDVAIVKVTPTRMGDRIDFEALDNPDPVRKTDVEAEA